MASRANTRRCMDCGKRKPGNAFGAGAGSVCRNCAAKAHDARKAREAMAEAREKKRADDYVARVKADMERL